MCNDLILIMTYYTSTIFLEFSSYMKQKIEVIYYNEMCLSRCVMAIREKP